MTSILLDLAVTVAVIAVVLRITIGFPIIGGALPRIGRRRLALNRDGSFVDTGAALIEDEVGYYFVEPLTLEWLGLGIPLTRSHVRLTSTGEIADHDFEVPGEEVAH